MAGACGYACGFAQIFYRCHGAPQDVALMWRIKALYAVGISNKFANDICRQAHAS